MLVSKKVSEGMIVDKIIEVDMKGIGKQEACIVLCKEKSANKLLPYCSLLLLFFPKQLLILAVLCFIYYGTYFFFYRKKPRLPLTNLQPTSSQIFKQIQQKDKLCITLPKVTLLYSDI